MYHQPLQRCQHGGICAVLLLHRHAHLLDIALNPQKAVPLLHHKDIGGTVPLCDDAALGQHRRVFIAEIPHLNFSVHPVYRVLDRLHRHRLGGIAVNSLLLQIKAGGGFQLQGKALPLAGYLRKGPVLFGVNSPFKVPLPLQVPIGQGGTAGGDIPRHNVQFRDLSRNLGVYHALVLPQLREEGGLLRQLGEAVPGQLPPDFVLEANGDKWTTTAEAYVSNGPFKITEMNTDLVRGADRIVKEMLGL